MTTSFIGRLQPDIHDLQSQTVIDVARTQSQRIGIVVLAAHFSHDRAGAECASDSTDLVGNHAHSDTGTTNDDGAIRDTIRDTRDLTNNLIDRMTGTWGKAAQRWLDGMTRDDVLATTQELGGHLNEFAQQVYTVAENDFKGQPRPRPEGEQ